MNGINIECAPPLTAPTIFKTSAQNSYNNEHNHKTSQWKISMKVSWITWKICFLPMIVKDFSVDKKIIILVG